MNNDRLKELQIDEIIWIIFITVSITNIIGDEFEKNKELRDISILDIAPTIAHLMDLEVPREWEGKSLVNNM